MCDSVPYFVVVRYRNPKLTCRMRFASYHDANEYVNSIITCNKFSRGVMPQEVVMQIVDDCDGLPY